MPTHDAAFLTQTVHAYLAALASGATGDALSRFFTADAVQIEFPNQLNPRGRRSDVPTLLLRAEQGQKILRTQRYDVSSITVQGDRVAVEAAWSAVLAVPVATLAAGAEMKAQFAMFFEFRNGLIAVQRNYDCFEPW